MNGDASAWLFDVIASYQLGPLLLERYKRLSEEFYQEDRRLYVRKAKWTQLLSLLGTCTFYGAYAAMASRTAGVMDVGSTAVRTTMAFALAPS